MTLSKAGCPTALFEPKLRNVDEKIPLYPGKAPWLTLTKSNILKSEQYVMIALSQ